MLVCASLLVVAGIENKETKHEKTKIEEKKEKSKSTPDHEKRKNRSVARK